VIAGARADGDNPYAGLHKATCEEQALAQMREASKLSSFGLPVIREVESISLADGLRLLGEVERPARLWARDELEGFPVMAIELVNGGCELLTDCLVQRVPKREPVADAV